MNSSISLPPALFSKMIIRVACECVYVLCACVQFYYFTYFFYMFCFVGAYYSIFPIKYKHKVPPLPPSSSYCHRHTLWVHFFLYVLLCSPTCSCSCLCSLFFILSFLPLSITWNCKSMKKSKELRVQNGMLLANRYVHECKRTVKWMNMHVKKALWCMCYRQTDTRAHTLAHSTYFGDCVNVWVYREINWKFMFEQEREIYIYR